VVSRYRVRYLLTMEGIITERFRDELPRATPLREGDYILYRFDATDGRGE
jgi:hypothetical protein